MHGHHADHCGYQRRPSMRMIQPPATGYPPQGLYPQGPVSPTPEAIERTMAPYVVCTRVSRWPDAPTLRPPRAEFMMHRPVPGLSRNDRKGKMVQVKMHSFPWRPIWVPLRFLEQWHPGGGHVPTEYIRARTSRCPLSVMAMKRLRTY